MSVFKNKNRQGNKFHFKDQTLKDFTSGIVYKIQFGLCDKSYYGECVRQFNVRIDENIGISPLTRKQVKPKNSSVANHLLLCNHSASYDNFSILTCENKTFLLELKESLLIIRDKESMNINITSAPLYLFDRPSNKIFVRILFAFNSCNVILIEWAFYFVMCKSMCTTILSRHLPAQS